MKSGRGGKRAGAGRPISERGKLRRYTARLYPDQIAYLKNMKDASAFIRKLIDRGMG